MPKINLSIIIPIYKVESEENFGYFEHLVASIAVNFQGQPRADGSDFALQEIIVINDYPLHDSEARVKALFEKQGLGAALVYVNQPENRGQAAARNAAAHIAKGNYLHFIDQDDYISEGYYAALFAGARPAAVLMANIFIARNGKTPYAYLKNNTQRTYGQAQKLSDLKHFLISNIAVSPGQYVVSKQAFEAVNGFPDLQNRGSDDYGIMFNLSQQGVSYRFCPKARFYYRLHEKQNRNVLSISNSVQEFFSQQQQPLEGSFRYLSAIKRYSLRVPAIGKIFFTMYFNRQ